MENFQQQDGDYDSGEQQYEPSDDINNVPLVNPINEDSDLDPHSNSSQDASYGSGGQQHNPAYQYYYRNYNDWPYNKNDPNRYPRGYAYHYGNNTNSNNNVNDIDPGSVDPNNPNSNNVNIGNQNFDGVNPNNPGNIRPGNVYPGGKQIKRVNNNINYVVLTDCNGQKRKLSQNDVMNLIKQGVIQYQCN